MRLSCGLGVGVVKFGVNRIKVGMGVAYNFSDTTNPARKINRCHNMNQTNPNHFVAAYDTCQLMCDIITSTTQVKIDKKKRYILLQKFEEKFLFLEQSIGIES